jgi:hypothetical protein
MAGRNSKKRTRKSRRADVLKNAATAMAAARSRRIAARRTLADCTHPGDHGLILPRSMEWARTLLRAKTRSLHNTPGVVGTGLGFKVIDGVKTATPSLTVFVREKVAEGELRAQRQQVFRKPFRKGSRRLASDVVALGKLTLHAAVGDSIGSAMPRTKGTLGVVATDLDTGNRCALTAMHVTALFEFPADGVAPRQFTTPSRLDNPAAGPFGTLSRGTRTGVDAASIALAIDAENEIPVLGPIAGWRPTTFPGDDGATVWMYGATSGLQPGVIEYPHVDMPDDTLGELILARIHSAEGDSGALLVDNNRIALGLLVGAYENGLRAFSSIALVQALLNCSIE